MKKIFSITLLLGVAIMFAACQGEEEDLFDKSAAERLNEVAKTYSDILSDASAGWVMEYYPTNRNSDPTGLGYLMLVNFQKNGFVKVGMLNDLTDNLYEEDESVWEVITDNGPVLSFSTYNSLLHFFSDPAIYDQGNGLSGDYEFVMVDVPDDHESIMLKGKKRGTYVRLSRLPEGTDFETYLKDVLNFQNSIFPRTAPNFDYVTLDGKVYTFDEPYTTLPNIYLKGYDAIANEYHLPFIVTKQKEGYSLRFRTTLKFDDNEGEQEFIYNPEANIFYGVKNSENFISGAPASAFFGDAMQTGHSWNLRYEGEMSQSMKAQIDKLYDELYTGFQSKFKRFNFSINKEGKAEVAMYYRGINPRTGKELASDSKATYLFGFETVNDCVKLTYEGPSNTAAENISNSVASLQEILNMFTATYNAKPVESSFNLTNINVTLSDTDKSFVLNYVK